MESNVTDPSAEALEPVSDREASSESASQGDGERDETGRYLSREAAGYRRRLRETETERDALRAQVDALHRTEVERLAGQGGLAVPSDVWTFGATLDTLRSETGELDAETVTGVVDDILRSRPGMRAPKNGDLGIGRGGAAAPRREPNVGLSALLKP